MTTTSCEHCRKPIARATTGRAPRYCSTKCRMAAFRAAGSRDEAAAAQEPTPRYETAPAASTRRARYAGHACPQDPEHGPLLPWTGSDRWGWYCPSSRHEGRAFYTTDEIAVPTPRSAADIPAAPTGTGTSEPDRQRIGAPDPSLPRAALAGAPFSPDPDPRAEQGRTSLRPGSARGSGSLPPVSDPVHTLGL